VVLTEDSMRNVHTQRGSTLLFALVLLGVLTALAVAAVSLGSRERANAASKVRLDQLQACAAAAEAQLWAELARFGTGYLGSERGVGAVTLPDGRRLAAPAHYGTNLDGSVRVRDITMTVKDGAGGSSATRRADRTNTIVWKSMGGDPTRVTATCIDRDGREFEVELAVRFAL
jgi:hypothetical protein